MQQPAKVSVDAGRLRVLIVDDDVVLSVMLQEYLEAEGFSAQVAGNGDEGLSHILSGGHDLIILDVMLPRLNGIDILRRVRQASDVPVIMLTAKGDNLERVIGLELGADDYVPKPCFPRELVARMRAVLRRQRELPQQRQTTFVFGALKLDAGARRASLNGRELSLTACEFELLMALARSGDHVASKEELSLAVLGRAREPYDRSIDVHVSNLRHKLHDPTPTMEIETIRGHGYRLRSST